MSKNKVSMFLQGNNPQDQNKNSLFYTGLFSPMATVFFPPCCVKWTASLVHIYICIS